MAIDFIDVSFTLKDKYFTILKYIHMLDTQNFMLNKWYIVPHIDNHYYFKKKNYILITIFSSLLVKNFYVSKTVFDS